MASCALAPAFGAARAAPAQAPTLSGAYIVGDGAALVMMGYIGWANVWTAADNGSSIYSQSFYLTLFNLRETPTAVVVQVTEGSNSSDFVSSQTVDLPAVSERDITVTLPAEAAWIRTVFVFDGVPTWVGQTATPVSLFPSYIANVGGLDLLGLAIVSFMVLISVGAFGLARWALRRAVWAPKFSLLIWGHVVIAALGIAVFLDYQQIDATFAGWSPLVYPWAVFPMVFFTSLSYFNRAPRVEVLQGIATESGEMAYRRTLVRAGMLPDGRTVFIGETWWDFWARFWGHHAVMDEGSATKEPPFLAAVVNGRSPTSRRQGDRRAKSYPIGPQRLFAFRAVNPQEDDVAFIAWGKGSEPIRVAWPRLHVHRWVTVPAKYAPSSVSDKSVVITPERKVRKLAWPHYESSTSPTVELEDRHYVYAAAVWAGFASLRDLARVVSKMGTELAMVKAAVHNRVEDEVYTRLRALETLSGRTTSGMSEAEAEAFARELPGLTATKTSSSTGGNGGA